MKKAVLILSVLFIFWNLPARGRSDQAEQDGIPYNFPVLPYYKLMAFHLAYPERVSEPFMKDGDWCILLDEEEFYWAQGRLLHKYYREIPFEYSMFDIFPYPEVELKTYTDKEAAIIKKNLDIDFTEKTGYPRNVYFFECLYGIHTREDCDNVLVPVDFLGYPLKVHPMIKAPLERVEKQITVLAQSDNEVRRFLESLFRIDCHNFRRIAGTSQLSLHSFGIAVDFLPYTYGKKEYYWYNTGRKDWYKIPVKKRWMPPEQIVSIFEKEGFVWGGKWFKFDNVHFEYRPEVLILSRRLNGK